MERTIQRITAPLALNPTAQQPLVYGQLTLKNGIFVRTSDAIQSSVEDCIVAVGDYMNATVSELWAMPYQEFWRHVVKAHAKAAKQAQKKPDNGRS